MKKTLYLIFLYCGLVHQSTSTLGLDLSSNLNATTYKCFKEQGFTFAIPRAFRSYGQVDTNANSNLKNAKDAGLSTDIYMFPCRGKNPDVQVDQMMAKVDSKLYNKVWIDVQTNPSKGCSWNNQSGPSNCKFIESIVSKIKQYNKPVGIYTNLNNWVNIIKDRNGCKDLGVLDLWYAHYDNIANFEDFKPFGGWTNPYMKQFQGDVKVCGANIDRNYKEVSAASQLVQDIQQINVNEVQNQQDEYQSYEDQLYQEDEDEIQEVDDIEEFDEDNQEQWD